MGTAGDALWSSAGTRGFAGAACSQLGVLSTLPERQSYSMLAARSFQTSRRSLVDSAAAQPINRLAVGEAVPIGGVHYKVIGRVEDGKAYEVPRKDVFAVVEVGPHQFKVTTDDLIYVEKLGDVDINDKARSRECIPFFNSLTPEKLGSRPRFACPACPPMR